jgi:hypothetical protein
MTQDMGYINEKIRVSHGNCDNNIMNKWQNMWNFVFGKQIGNTIGNMWHEQNLSTCYLKWIQIIEQLLKDFKNRL